MSILGRLLHFIPANPQVHTAVPMLPHNRHVEQLWLFSSKFLFTSDDAPHRIPLVSLIGRLKQKTVLLPHIKTCSNLTIFLENKCNFTNLISELLKMCSERVRATALLRWKKVLTQFT